MFASVSAGINALFGPLHGGANQAVLEMLDRIQADGGLTAQDFVAKVKDRETGVPAHGLRPPGLQELRPARGDRQEAATYDVLQQLRQAETRCSTSRCELEEIALADDYFVSRKLYPNVDFYTGLIYKAMGFPPKMFTVLFALGRLPGWIAQWREMIEDPATKIGRPRQVYVGPAERDLPRALPLPRH